jgi:hypothetical protein
VGEELRGLTVECGGCEHRFRINDEVIVRGKKFYPGERKDSKLNRFQRVPLAMSSEIGGLASIRYTDAPNPTAFEPVAPQRIIAGVIGVTGMIFMALLLMFGASRGGTLDGMTTLNRLLMGGFTGLLGIVLLVYANPRARLKAGAIGLLMSGGLLALPWFFTVGSMPLPPVDAAAVAATKPAPAGAESESVAELRNLIGTAPLVAEIERLARDGSTKHAVGLWLKGLSEQNRFLVRDYILRVTGADPQSHYYSRGGGDFLMVVTGIDQSLDEMAKIAAVLGSLEKVYAEIQVVEVRVNNENLVGSPIEKLTDKKNPEFYDLNKKELDSIDLDRVLHAVQRLADAEPKIYRNDIARKLIALLGMPGVSFKGDICRALAVWAEQPGPAGDAALKEATGLLGSRGQVPQEMIALIVKEKNPAVIPVLDALWIENPPHWEALYGDIGPAAEASLIGRFATTEGMARQSAVRLLGRVGGKDSLPVLEAAAAGGVNPEMKVLLEKASASIRSRLGH